MFGLALVVRSRVTQAVAELLALYDSAVKPFGNAVFGSCPSQRHFCTTLASSALMARNILLFQAAAIGWCITTSTRPVAFARLETGASNATTLPPSRKVMARGGRPRACEQKSRTSGVNEAELANSPLVRTAPVKGDVNANVTEPQSRSPHKVQLKYCTRIHCIRI